MNFSNSVRFRSTSAALAVNIFRPDWDDPSLPRQGVDADGPLGRSPPHNVPNKSETTQLFGNGLDDLVKLKAVSGEITRSGEVLDAALPGSIIQTVGRVQGGYSSLRGFCKHWPGRKYMKDCTALLRASVHSFVAYLFSLEVGRLSNSR